MLTRLAEARVGEVLGGDIGTGLACGAIDRDRGCQICHTEVLERVGVRRMGDVECAHKQQGAGQEDPCPLAAAQGGHGLNLNHNELQIFCRQTESTDKYVLLAERSGAQIVND